MPGGTPMKNWRRSRPSLLALLAILGMTTACGREQTSDADAGNGGRVCRLPSCVAQVADACQPVGGCTYDALAVMDNLFCYANGVRVRSTVGADSTQVTVTKADGKTTCWTVDRVLMGAAGKATLTYRDGARRTVATGTVDSEKRELTVTCPGQAPVTLDWDCRGIADTGIAGGQVDVCRVSPCL
jgi:hypothetical protein